MLHILRRASGVLVRCWPVFGCCVLACVPSGRQRLPEALPVDSTWQFHSVPRFRVGVRMPPDYVPRNQYGCFVAPAAGADTLDARGQRDVCISVLRATEAESLEFENVTRATQESRRTTRGCYDCMTYRQIQTDTTRLAGRTAIVQRALGTGGLAQLLDQREIFVRLTAGFDSVIAIRGKIGDARGEAEVLSAASTVKLQAEP
jgi:hypothetical protein